MIELWPIDVFDVVKSPTTRRVSLDYYDCYHSQLEFRSVEMLLAELIQYSIIRSFLLRASFWRRSSHSPVE
jgi:hypothetical protein